MENKDTNTDYQKFTRVRGQKWEIVEITIRIIFLLEISIHYFSYREFLSPTWKNSPPPKAPIPTQIPIWPKSLLYKWNVLKTGSAGPPPSPGGGGGENYGDPVKTYLFDTETFDSYLKVIQNRARVKYKKLKTWNINDIRYTARKLVWQSGCRIW